MLPKAPWLITVTMNTTTAGVIDGGNIALPVAGGSQVFVQVFAWDSTYSNPDAALVAGAFFVAWSAGPNNTTYGDIGAAELTSDLTISPAPGAPIFGTGAGQFGKAFYSTPEPGTIVIGGLGAAALLLFRRRK
jgi:PEP-CTERM motif